MYYMFISVSGPVSFPGMPVSARVRSIYHILDPKLRGDLSGLAKIRGRYKLSLFNQVLIIALGEAHHDWLKLGGDTKFYYNMPKMSLN